MIVKLHNQRHTMLNPDKSHNEISAAEQQLAVIRGAVAMPGMAFEDVEDPMSPSNKANAPGVVRSRGNDTSLQGITRTSKNRKPSLFLCLLVLLLEVEAHQALEAACAFPKMFDVADAINWDGDIVEPLKKFGQEVKEVREHRTELGEGAVADR